MSVMERRRHSLEAKTFSLLVRTGILIGIVLMIVGLSLYTATLVRQYISHGYYISKYASMSSTQTADAAGLCNSVMDIYNGLSEEQRAMCGTEEYRALFDSCLDNGDYEKLMHVLPMYATEEVSYIYLAMYDEENCRMVYVVDPSDETDKLYPGEWEEVEEAGMRRFLDWDGDGMLYEIDHTAKYGWLCTAGTPIYDDAGKLAGFLLVDISVGNIWSGMRLYTLQIILSLIAVIILLVLIASRRLRRTVVDPINSIAECAQNYVDDKKNGIHNSEHFSKLDIHTGDEIENLSLTMADMEKEMSDYIDTIASITAEKERISTELSVATRIQAAMLPHIFPAFPDRPEFDVYATMDPAKEVGGDFYNYFLIDDDHLCLVMADVSGKGVPAALFMMASKIMLANYAKMGKTPAEILTITNDTISSNNREEMFVTVWLGIFEISTGKLVASNAGHEYPILKKDGKFEIYKDHHGMVIGYEEGMVYKDYEIVMKPGDKLFLYTDGVTEATDDNEKLFGMERMIDALNKDPETDPVQTLKNVRAGVDAFVKDAEQFDDLTMLCFEYRSPERS